MPPHKEIHYFNKLHIKNLLSNSLVSSKARKLIRARIEDNLVAPSLTKLCWDVRYLCLRRNDAWYRALFRSDVNSLSGDISPAYSTLSASLVDKIVAMLPNVRVVFILRNPIDRAWSHAKMDFARFRGMRIDQASHAEVLAHFESEASELRCNYVRTLEIWEERISPDKMFVAFFEEIVQHPNVFLERVVKFLAPECMLNPATALAPVNQTYTADIPPALHRHLIRKYQPLIFKLYAKYKSPILPWIQSLG
jgi:hypothetical protein